MEAMGLMKLPIHPGPQNLELLTLQEHHKSQAIWDGAEVRPLRCRSHIRVLGDFDVDDRVVDFLRGTQFFGIHKFVSMKFDVDLISALVERWRQETHTFHLPFGEVTVTLQDVQVLLGLAVGGDVVSGSTNPNPGKAIETALGLAPGDEDLSGTALKIGWLVRNFRGLPNNATEEVLHHHVRAYLLILFGTILFPDKSGSYVQVIWLPLLSNLDRLDKYSWGSAVLATLYRNLCRASRIGAMDIGGPLILLQIWAWERISIGRPMSLRPRYEACEHNANPFGSQHQIRVDPLGCRWLRIERKRADGPSSLRGYRDALDSMTNDHFIWQPYSEEIMFFLPDECKSKPEEWVVITPIICFDIVEWHLPNRVMRQFGWKQEIPKTIDTCIKLHNIDKRGAHSTCWITKHRKWIDFWNSRRYDRAVGVPIDDHVMNYHDPYMVWYRERTRRLISPLTRGEPTEYQAFSGPMHLLTEAFAQVHMTCLQELQSMPPEVSPHYRGIMANMCRFTSECLQKVGYQHLISPKEEVANQEDEVMPDDSPLIHFIRRIRNTGPLSPVMEVDAPGSSSTTRSKTHQSKKKKT